MKTRISRRALVAAAIGAGGLYVAGRNAARPPAIRGVFGAVDALTYAAHRALQVNQPLAREFGRHMITAKFPVNGMSNPPDAGYQKLLAGRFTDWRLPVEGLVATPRSFSLAELRAMPARTQVTMQACEEGWSAIAEWTGVPLSRVLDAAGIRPEAKYVVFHTVDGWFDSIDMHDVLHPQTLLAYGMNGGDLPVAYGAPLRLRVERQLGYKNLKYVSRIQVTDRVDQIGDGTGSGSYSAGFAWYAGI